MTEQRDVRWRSAILEGAAVLIGILLAFSIEAWWDLRTQRAEEASYIEAVRTELQANRDFIAENLDSLRAWTGESQGYLENVATAGRNASYEDVAEMVWETGPRDVRPLARSALDDLVSSGGFQILRSPELRRALARYQRALERDLVEQEEVRLFFSETVQDYHIAYGSFSAFPWEEYVGVPQSASDFPLPVEEFVANRTYANLLIVRMLQFSNLRDTHQAVLEEILSVLGFIEGAS
jgi:hypothetical protein